MRARMSGLWMLITANVVVYMLENALGDSTISQFALWPLQGHFLPWQLITYAFLHAGIAHIALNMFGLWMFGRDIEHTLGRRAFLQLYFTSVLTAGLAQLLVTTYTGGSYPTIGASGGVFGVLLAYAMFYPRRVIILLIPPIPMPAWLFVTIYAVVELALGVTGTQEGVAHFAHLGGMVGAFLTIRHWQRRARR